MQGVPPDADVSFAVLGPLEVRQDGRRVEIGGRRLRALLTLLLLDAGRTVPTGALVAGVWDDSPPGGVGNALQALRNTIDRGLVAADPSGYRLLVAPEQVDVHRFLRMSREGARALEARDPGLAARTLGEALALWRGAPLADLPGGALEVVRLEGARVSATEDRIEAELALAQDVVSELTRLVAAHPLRERLRGLLMRALYGSGRQVEALAAYEDARAVFAERLGADPSPSLAELHLALLRGDLPRTGLPYGAATAAPDAAAHDGAPATRKGNLRARLTSFVGRDDEVLQARSLLGENRLVTLLGPGGAGKTRLAVESAEEFAVEVRDGVWLVELAPVLDPEEVSRAVLAALGMRDTGLVRVRPAGQGVEADATARLMAALSGRSTLIVLDNCEHLVGAAAALADRLLAECPGVRILVTSRRSAGPARPPQSSVRLRGSSPVVGSSRKSTWGRPTRLAARSRRRRMPPE
ncbi:hypothetical protein Pth03_28720 [Planotetraspora thailandica]|uniref:Bacterial transcriptional activator domain-containing protein n=1 Tax=Planotetraspora thailandica TaxID=487172 RepID=A0A8J3XYJ4_9ACTN|nr:hypothetical protein Pth03_28720 [Planotetraspora thailandica]